MSNLIFTRQKHPFSASVVMLVWKTVSGVLKTNKNTHSKNHIIRILAHHTQTQLFYGSLVLSEKTWVSQYQKKQSPTHTYRGHQSSLICFLHLLWSMVSSLFINMPYSHFPQSLSKFSLVYLLARNYPLHTPNISSSNHCLLFAAHAHTTATCFAIVLRLCHLILVSLSTLYFELYLVA